jgi:hypothetical protein
MGDPYYRSLFVVYINARLVEIILVVEHLPEEIEVTLALAKVVGCLLRIATVNQVVFDSDAVRMVVFRNTYPALHLAMQFLTLVPDEALKTSKLEEFFEIFHERVQNIRMITNDASLPRSYAYSTLFCAFAHSIRMVKALQSIEEKNRFLSRVFGTFAHMRQTFEQLTDERLKRILRYDINWIQNLEFPENQASTI